MTTAVKERAILFSGEMVRAILSGRKVQTRRVMRGNFAPDELIRKKSGTGYGWWPFGGSGDLWGMTGAVGIANDAGFDTRVKCPYGVLGDRLWVRETFAATRAGEILYRADPMFDGAKVEWDWRPSIFMPREACRIRLEITEVRVQRLQEITEEDAKAEGVIPTVPLYGDNGGHIHEGHKESFGKLWDSINAKRGFGWSVNPWVWCVSFKGSSSGDAAGG